MERRGARLAATALMAAIGLGVTVGLWFVAADAGASPVMPAIASTARTGGQAPASDGTTTRADPAANRLRQVTYGLLAVGGVLLVGTAWFWKATRPALVEPRPTGIAPAAPSGDRRDAATATEVSPHSSETAGVASTSTPAAANDRAAASSGPVSGAAGSVAAASSVAAGAASPGKISAAAFLATAPGSAAAATLAAGATGAAEAADATSTTSLTSPAERLAPPEGAPALDGPAPLADIPLGAVQPLSGTDAAWRIERDRPKGLIDTPPSAGDFPQIDASDELDAMTAAAAVDAVAIGDAVHDVQRSTEPAEPAEPAMARDAAPAEPAAPATAAPGPDRRDPTETVSEGSEHGNGAQIDGDRSLPDIDRRVNGDAPAPDADVIEVTGTDRAASTSDLFAALAAIPDQESVRVSFDDPPVERVRRSSPKGAPGFDRIARETASQATVDVRSSPAASDRIDGEEAGHGERATSDAGDIDVRAAEVEPTKADENGHDVPAERRDRSGRRVEAVATAGDAEMPPVGMFYDQDLDPGDPPGRG